MDDVRPCSIDGDDSDQLLFDPNVNLEDFTVVWLDAQLNQRPDCLDTKRRLRSIIHFLRTFDSVPACLSFLQSREPDDSKVFLIVSGKFGKEIVPIIYNLPHIEYIYVFCQKRERHEEWVKKFAEKVRDIYTEKDPLFIQLVNDVKQAKSNLVSELIDMQEDGGAEEQTIHSSTFAWYQWMLRVLLQTPKTPSSKHDMIRECRSYYQDNECELKKIDEFDRSYEPATAIWWYTRDSFVYRLLNKSLRTQNMTVIFRFRFFIVDLYQRVRLLSKFASSKLLSYPLTVYRGQRMSSSEHARIQPHRIISINTFFSTTKNSQVALLYAGKTPVSKKQNMVSVLFEIDICEPSKWQNSKSRPFAGIQHGSSMIDEEELLFCLGTKFRVESIEQYETFSCVKLTLYDVEEEKTSMNNVALLLSFLRQKSIKSNDKKSGMNNIKKMIEESKMLATTDAIIYSGAALT